MIQQLHFKIFIEEKWKYTKAWNMHVHSNIIRSSQKLEKNPSVHQLVNEYAKYDIPIQYNTIWE